MRNGEAMQGEEYQAVLNANMEQPWTKTWSNLPAVDEQGASYKYTVAEVDVPDNYEASVSGVENGIVTITNTYARPEAKTGSLAITKLVNEDEGQAPADAVFSFAVFLNGSETADYTFSLKAGETYNISNLAVGTTYVVNETDRAGAYRTDVKYSDSSAAENGTTNSGVISAADERDMVTVTNYYQSTPENPGDYNPGNDEPNLPDPNEPGAPDEVTIIQDDVPLTYIKVQDPETEEYVYLPEDEVPMASVPKTGDNLLLWFFAAAVSGLAALATGRKRK